MFAVNFSLLGLGIALLLFTFTVSFVVSLISHVLLLLLLAFEVCPPLAHVHESRRHLKAEQLVKSAVRLL